jgi:hypothetical protein
MDSTSPQKPMLSELEAATVHVSGNDKITVEFRIDDLIKRLLPDPGLAAHCGGCNGCMGCSM